MVCIAGIMGKAIFTVQRLQKTGILFYQQKTTNALQLVEWQISFLHPQWSRNPQKIYLGICVKDYTLKDLFSVSLIVNVICNGVISIATGLRKTELVYSSQVPFMDIFWLIRITLLHQINFCLYSDDWIYSHLKSAHKLNSFWSNYNVDNTIENYCYREPLTMGLTK